MPSVAQGETTVSKAPRRVRALKVDPGPPDPNQTPQEAPDAQKWVVEDLMGLLLSLRDSRKEIYADIACIEAALIRFMAERGMWALTHQGYVFKRVPGGITGSPSKRRRWRKNRPPWALNEFQQPERLEISYKGNPKKPRTMV